MNLNGGYIIINKDDANIYAKAIEALTIGKPILFYENNTTCYYIDTIALSGDDIVLTKGGKTITITDANVVTETGDIQNHLYQHNICLYGNDSNEKDLYASIIIFNNSSTEFDDLELLYNYIKSNFTNEISNNFVINGTVDNISIYSLWTLTAPYSIDALNFRTIDDDNHNLGVLSSINDKVIQLF